MGFRTIPWGAVLPSLLGVVCGVAYGAGVPVFVGDITADSPLFLRVMVHRPWFGFGLGFAIGLGASFYEFVHIMRHREFFARRVLRDQSLRLSDRLSAVNLLAWVPVAAGLFLAPLIAVVAGWSAPMAAFGVLTSVVVTFPVERGLLLEQRGRTHD